MAALVRTLLTGQHLEQLAAADAIPRERVAGLYADYRNWPRLFPTIKGVRLIGREVKRRYDARFVNRFETVPGGTRLTVRGDIALKGWAKLLQPFLRGYVRRQVERLQLQPLKAAAEER